jgi:hypothetical protein
MASTVGQRYRCQNPDCRDEIEMTSSDATTLPKCSCGAPMKQMYTEPIIKELDGHPVFTWVKKTSKHA